MKKKEFPIFSIIAICLGISIAFTAFVVFLEHRNEHDQLNSLMVNRIDQMTNSVNSALQEVYAVQSLVLGTYGENCDLSVMGEFLIHDEFREYVRNVLIAPDGVVSQVYPLEGNENVIGLNLYSSDNASNEEAMQARDSEKPVVTGPFNLVQGGEAISGRIAVRLPQPDGTYKNWGLVSITLNFPQVMENTATNVLIDKGYVFQVLKYDEGNDTYREILNHDFAQGNDCETIFFKIQGMDFEIKAAPANGWVDIAHCIRLFLFTGIIFCVIGVSVYLMFKWQHGLHTKATTDALTGLVNRSNGEVQINKRIKAKDFVEGAFLLLDIDHFKNVNDTLGHQAGDEVLVEAADIFKAVFRSRDIICRLGGDEFVIFLEYEHGPDFIQDKVTQLLNSMRRKVLRKGQSVVISCSVGIALAPKDAVTFDGLYQKADKALYASKESGRDKATLFTERDKI